jgi:hypothetical protein
MEIALVEMEEGEQGSLAGSLENIDLDIDHMQVIHLEGAVATLGVAEDTEVVLEEHAQGCAAGCGCYAIGVIKIVVATGIDGGYDLGFLEQTVEGVDILEDHSSGITDVKEQVFLVDLVPGIGVTIGLALEPIGIHIMIDGLVGESEFLLAWGTVEQIGGIFEDVDLGMERQMTHQGLQGMGLDVIVGIDESDVFATGFLDTLVTGIAQAAILLVNDADALVFGSPTVTDLRTVIGRPVVD